MKTSAITTTGEGFHVSRADKVRIALASAASIGLIAAPHVEKRIHEASDNIHQVSEAAHYSQRGLLNTEQQDGTFDAAKELTYTVGPGDVPSAIAHKLHAKDEMLVSSEISGQEGGDTKLQPNDVVVLPRDQFDLPENN